MSEQIGIVLVHGIGEQKRFEHLSTEVLEIIRSLKTDKNIDQVSVQPHVTQDAEYAAENQIWLSEDGAPLQIDFFHSINNEKVQKSLFIHEVWWADLDNKSTLWEWIRFYFWVCSLWVFERYNKSDLPGAAALQVPSSLFDPKKDFLVRLRLAAVGLVFLLASFSLIPMAYFLRKIGLNFFRADILFQYLGDVKLYQDFLRVNGATLTDFGIPPRYSIRRRMVQVLVDACSLNYDRWYVLAHSLGSVVAWNGLMETEHCLPNYLNEKTWKKCLQKEGLVIQLADKENTNDMRPARPLWIKDDQAALSRNVLFEKLRGFVTYGSPLDKFAYLWGAIVPINPQKPVFADKFEWLNIFDHTDPVAASLDSYNAGPVTPKNYCYKAHPLLLYSHIKYLTFLKNKPDCFVNRLTEWILSNNDFPKPKNNDTQWDANISFEKGLKIRTYWWVGITALMSTVLGGLISFYLENNLSLALVLLNSLVVLVSVSFIVGISGITKYFWIKCLKK